MIVQQMIVLMVVLCVHPGVSYRTWAGSWQLDRLRNQPLACTACTLHVCMRAIFFSRLLSNASQRGLRAHTTPAAGTQHRHRTPLDLTQPSVSLQAADCHHQPPADDDESCCQQGSAPRSVGPAAAERASASAGGVSGTGSPPAAAVTADPEARPPASVMMASEPTAGGGGSSELPACRVTSSSDCTPDGFSWLKLRRIEVRCHHLRSCSCWLLVGSRLRQHWQLGARPLAAVADGRVGVACRAGGAREYGRRRGMGNGGRQNCMRAHRIAQTVAHGRRAQTCMRGRTHARPLPPSPLPRPLPFHTCACTAAAGGWRLWYNGPSCSTRTLRAGVCIPVCVWWWGGAGAGRAVLRARVGGCACACW